MAGQSKKKAKGNKLLAADIIISFVVVGVIGLIIIPLPAAVLDVLIVTNMAIAINI